jgi:hypothetical protein
VLTFLLKQNLFDSNFPGAARYLDALETRVGLKASRNEIIRHALRLFLETQPQAGRPTPPQRLHEP